MEDIAFESLYRTSQKMVQRVGMDFFRSLYHQINWDDRLIGIKGARGVGKTTMVLQHIKEVFAENPEQALYVSLDNLWFANHTLSDIVEYHYTHGGTHLFVDEIHKYPHWQTLLKNIYDEYPDLHVVYTGSSMLQINLNEGDLSRRQVLYTMHNLSFREFLAYEKNIECSAIPFDELLVNHVPYALNLTENVKILPLFTQYLQYGCYPFYKNAISTYDIRLQSVIRTVLMEDLQVSGEFTYPTLQKTMKMLMILAERVPQTPKMNELYALLDTNRAQGMKMLSMLEQAALLNLLSPPQKNFRQMGKPDKIYLNNPNLMWALTPHADIGTMRETFFMNQVKVVGEVNYPTAGDFLVNREFLFEVGGRGKTFDQIKDMPDSFLAVDGIETGHGHRIPLWMFGMMY